MDRGPEQTFFQRRHPGGQQVHEKIHNISNHQGNANQNHNEGGARVCQHAVIKKTRDPKCWRGCGEKGALIPCWWEYKLVQPLQKTVWRFLKKLEIKQPYGPTITLLGIYPVETKILKDTCISLSVAALLTVARTWKQPRCP